MLNPDLIAYLGWTGQTERGDVIAAIAIVGISLWEIVADFVRAARRRRAG